MADNSDLITKKVQDLKLDPRAKNLGNYLIDGGPGRGEGTKNKHTVIMEQIADTFLEAGGKEAFKKTLMNPDGTMNLEALEILLKYNPALSKAFGSALGNTVNIISPGQEAKKIIDVEVADG